MKNKVMIKPGQRGTGKTLHSLAAELTKGMTPGHLFDDHLDAIRTGISWTAWDFAANPLEWVYSKRKGGHIRHDRKSAHGYYECIYGWREPAVQVGVWDDPAQKAGWYKIDAIYKRRVMVPESEVPAVVRMALMLATV